MRVTKRPDDLPEWAEKIRRVRFDLDETQAEFGARFGVTQQAVANWEIGKSEPGATVMMFVLTGIQARGESEVPGGKA